MFLNSIARSSRAISKLQFGVRRVSAVSPLRASVQIPMVSGDRKDGYSSSNPWTASLFMLALCATIGSAVNDASVEKTSGKTWKTITRKEVESHCNENTGYWVTYGNGVYDITQFLANHPGGKDRLLGVAGHDIGDAWNLFQSHKNSSNAQKLLAGMKIGELAASEVIVAADVPHVAQYSNAPVYDVIIVGAGLSGLMCGSELINRYGVSRDKILVLEAQDYVGGRVKQVNDFIRGTKIEVGAEFLHGKDYVWIPCCLLLPWTSVDNISCSILLMCLLFIYFSIHAFRQQHRADEVCPCHQPAPA